MTGTSSSKPLGMAGIKSTTVPCGTLSFRLFHEDAQDRMTGGRESGGDNRLMQVHLENGFQVICV